MREFFRFPIRISAFLGKEVFEILRQPKLLLSLVVGPFLVLSLVGVGYRSTPRSFRTLFVIPQQSNLADQVNTYATSISPQFIIEGITDDEEAAKQRLRRGDVELVIVVPQDAQTLIQQNRQATFTIYHNELDPFQAGYVQFVGQYYVGELNKRILETVTQEGQNSASTVQDDVIQARSSATALRDALEKKDSKAAQQHQADLVKQLDGIDQRVGVSTGLIAGLAESVNNSGDSANTLDAAAVTASLTSARQNTDSLSTIPDDCSTCEAQVPVAEKIEGDLEQLQAALGKFDSISSNILISPFASETHSVAPYEPRTTDYFAPAVLALLLQHLAVTFAALSIVRERQLGTVELFRVSPLSAAEALLGKYLSYLIAGGLLAALLTGLIIYLMHVPMLGSWLNFVLVIAALLFASLGIGFVISLVADNDSQAIQYTMLVLLASVFFSGLFVSQTLIWEPMRVISWMLPVTYGLNMLQNIMLRGVPPNQLMVIGLVAIGLLLFMIAWVQMKRLLTRL